MECGECREWGECYIPGNVTNHSRECPETFQGMPPNILGNLLKHSKECRQILWGMLPNIPGFGNIPQNAWGDSPECLATFPECLRTFPGMLPNIPRNVTKHFKEYCKTFWGMSPNISRNVAKYSWVCCKTLQGMSPNIQGNILHALNSQIKLILAYISILFQKWNYLNFIFINESIVTRNNTMMNDMYDYDESKVFQI